MGAEENLELLTPEERAHYSRFARLKNLTVSERLRATRKTNALVVAVVLVSGSLLAWPSVELSTMPNGPISVRDDPGIFVLMVLGLLSFAVGSSFAVRSAIREPEVALKELRAAYLKQIDYAARVKRSRPSSDGTAEVSKRHADHLWYGKHSEFNWRDRVRGQEWGVDADTYANNFSEDDKD